MGYQGYQGPIGPQGPEGTFQNPYSGTIRANGGLILNGGSCYAEGRVIAGVSIDGNFNILSNPDARYAVYAYGDIGATGNKAFHIPHPVVANTQLVHACIESPRLDLVYRGTTRLVAGRAIVDIDRECTAEGCEMTPGTFEALTINPVVFLQATTFDRVIGTVQGSSVHIQSEDPASTAHVHWMVMAERYDTYARTSPTMRHGHLITEIS